MFKIVEKKILNQGVELMKVYAPFVSKRCLAGQFIILRIDEEGERIPLTIVDYDREEETIEIIYQKVGYSTQKLSTLDVNDEILDIVGPLGVKTNIHQHKRILGIGGGVGIAPLFPQLKAFSQLGTSVDVILGGRSKDFIILDDRLKDFCNKVYYATNDGSLGHEGFVTDVLKQLLTEGNEYDEIIAIGPAIMMKAVVDITKELNIKTSVSLNPLMIDGTGMCGACRVTVDGKVKFACVDGPDFDGLKVDFNELMARQNYYKTEESHICRLYGTK